MKPAAVQVCVSAVTQHITNTATREMQRAARIDGLFLSVVLHEKVVHVVLCA